MYTGTPFSADRLGSLSEDAFAIRLRSAPDSVSPTAIKTAKTTLELVRRMCAVRITVRVRKRANSRTQSSGRGCAEFSISAVRASAFWQRFLPVHLGPESVAIFI